MAQFSQHTVTVLVNGKITPFERGQTTHSVDTIGDATITLRRPLPTHVTSGTYGANGKPVTIVATTTRWTGVDSSGYRTGLSVESSTIFRGTVRDGDFDQGASGTTTTLYCQDDLWQMANNVYEPQSWSGAILANTLIRGLLAKYGYGDPGTQTSGLPPAYLDTIRFPDGSTITLGGISEIDEGKVIMRARQNRLAFAREIAAIAGYRLFSLPTGSPRLCRILGIPPSVAITDLFRADGGYRVVQETTGTIFQIRGGTKAREVANYIEVTGADWNEDDGSAISIRSFPAQAPYVGIIPAKVAIIHEPFSSSLITTQRMADGARQIREMDHGGVASEVSVSTDLSPTIYPGHVNNLISATNGLNSTHYVTRVAHAFDGSGAARSDVDYRRGAGTAQPAGVDVCQFQTVFSGSTHLGDEPVAHYATPSAFGTTRSWTYTPSGDKSSLALIARAHGTNSQLGSNGNVDLEASKIELIQAGDTVGSANLPVLSENYNEAFPYSSDTYWTDVNVAIPGTLQSGQVVTVKLTCGTDGVGADDFEIKNIRIMSCEQGQPLLPTYPAPPAGTTPTPPRTPPGSTAPGAGTGTAPDRPARIVLVNDGTAKPGSPALIVVTGLLLPQGRTAYQWNGAFSGLLATAGTYGAGMKEYGQLMVRNAAGTISYVRAQLVRLPADGGGVAAGSGDRVINFNVTTVCAGGPVEILAAGSGIYSESATVGITRLGGFKAT